MGFLGGCFLKLELFGDFDTLGQVCYSGVDGVALCLEFDAFLPEVDQADVEDFDEFVLFQLGFQVLVGWQAHVHAHVDHLEVGVAKAWVYMGWWWWMVFVSDTSKHK